jgi:hypothetical protein
MELRARKAWAAALLAVVVMALAPGRAIGDELDPGELKAIIEGRTTAPVFEPGELKARMESFSVGRIGSLDALDPGEFKAIAEAPARFDVLEPGELKALTEARAWPPSTRAGTGPSGSSRMDWVAAGVVSLVLLFTAGVGLLFSRRHDRIAPA